MSRPVASDEGAVVSADTIAAALRVHLPEREWALLFEVGNSTGAQCRRHADAVGMSLWPSRGYEIHGFEFKCSKTDLKREVENPEKADAVGAYCDHWWIVVSNAKILEGIEVPAVWGIMVLEDGAIVRKRHAKPLEAKPLSRGFVASLLRRASEAHNRLTDQAVTILRRRIESEQQNIINERVERTTLTLRKERDQLLAAMRTFEKETGLHVSLYDWQTREMARKLKLVYALDGLALESQPERLRRAADEIEKVAEALRPVTVKEMA